MALTDNLGKRLAGAGVGAAAGAKLGAGTGIVGGPLGAMAGVGVFATGGALIGFFAGPDVAESLADGISKVRSR